MKMLRRIFPLKSAIAKKIQYSTATEKSNFNKMVIQAELLKQCHDFQ